MAQLIGWIVLLVPVVWHLLAWIGWVSPAPSAMAFLFCIGVFLLLLHPPFPVPAWPWRKE
jgi:hypothetical protein